MLYGQFVNRWNWKIDEWTEINFIFVFAIIKISSKVKFKKMETANIPLGTC